MIEFGLIVLFLLVLYGIGLLGLSLFRLIEYLALHGMMSNQADGHPIEAFLRGLWFDNVVNCYIFIIPLAVVLLAACFGNFHKGWRKFATWWIGTLTVLVFALSASNIPYYAYFAKDINSSIFNWFSYVGTTTGMVFGERSWWLYIALFLIIAGLYVWIISTIYLWSNKKLSSVPGKRFKWQDLIVSMALIGLCVFGIRGRIGYNPIKISQAYYCNDAFLNQLGIAPAFNLLTSIMDDMRPENEELQLMPYPEAISLARKSLGISGCADSAHVLRQVIAEENVQRPNIVFILMESMSAALLHQGQTPTLDSLANHSLYFPYFYSAGIHTNHGIIASLYSFPALMKRNLMKGTVTPHRNGIPTILKKYGYHNMFFMTHEAQYDNMQAFLLTNGYDEVYSQTDYPMSERVNAFGVSDHFLFDYGLKTINQVAKKDTPWMATLLTISNHPPYVIPDWFHPHSSEQESQIVEYTDWCVGDFIKKAKQQAWWKNTVFIIVADHGMLVGKVNSELPASYNHIPLYIFGHGIQHETCQGLGTQVDIMPTLLSLLGMGYDYDGFGINLLKKQREMVFYTADDQIVGRDAKGYYIFKPATGQHFYYGNDPKSQEALHRYATSMIQTAEYLQQKEKREP